MMGDSDALKEKKMRKKKKKDKNRVTDLEEFDLEAEDPETIEGRLKKNASKNIGDVGVVSASVRKTVFGDIEDLTDEELTPRRPHSEMGDSTVVSRSASLAPRPQLGGFGVSSSFGGPLIQGSGMRKSGLAPLAPLGGNRQSLPGLNVGSLSARSSFGSGFGGGGLSDSVAITTPVMGSMFAPMRRSKTISTPVSSSVPVPVYNQQQPRASNESNEPDWLSSSGPEHSKSSSFGPMQPPTPDPTLPRGSGAGVIGRNVLYTEATVPMSSPIPMEPAVSESPAVLPPHPPPKKDSYGDFTWKDEDREGEEPVATAPPHPANDDSYEDLTWKDDEDGEVEEPVAPAPPPPPHDDSYGDLTWRDDEVDHGNKGILTHTTHNQLPAEEFKNIFSAGGVEDRRLEEEPSDIPMTAVKPSMNDISLFDADEKALMAELGSDESPPASPATIAMVRAVPDTMEDSMEMSDAAENMASQGIPTTQSLADDPYEVVMKVAAVQDDDGAVDEEDELGDLPDDLDDYAEPTPRNPEPTPRFDPDAAESQPAMETSVRSDEEGGNPTSLQDPDDDPWSGFQQNYGLAEARKSGVLADLNDDNPLDNSFTHFQRKQEREQGGERMVRLSGRRSQNEEILVLDDSISNPQPRGSQGGIGVDKGQDEPLSKMMGGGAAAGWAGGLGMDDDGFEAGDGIDYDDVIDDDDDDDVFGTASSANRGGGDIFSADISELDISAS